MIPFHEALSIVETQDRRLPTEEVELQAAVGRCLVETLTSDIDHPPFSKAAMDGYAVVAGDESEAVCLL